MILRSLTAGNRPHCPLGGMLGHRLAVLWRIGLSVPNLNYRDLDY
jgi:hypothetical protein